MKIFRITLIIGLFVFLAIFGVSKYKNTKEQKHTYHSMHESKGGIMIIGGSANDKAKIDAFKESLEEEGFQQYWDLLHEASSLRKKGDFGGAIKLYKQALQYGKSNGDRFQIFWGLAKLYEENEQYELAIEQLKKVPEVNNREDVQKEAKDWISRLEDKVGSK